MACCRAGEPCAPQLSATRCCCLRRLTVVPRCRVLPAKVRRGVVARAGLLLCRGVVCSQPKCDVALLPAPACCCAEVSCAPSQSATWRCCLRRLAVVPRCRVLPAKVRRGVVACAGLLLCRGV